MREEIIRGALHDLLKKAFKVQYIHSEYGMAELMSQAYAKKEGLFDSPPWMKVVTRDAYNPLRILPPPAAGGINIIDLANYHSCAFLETQDLGISHANGQFEVIGRFDNSEVRGCNLMVV